tara:strand:+ start:858 stop:1292 length:435 start_codon:yes stop_codon:yes gene_type:complete
MSPKKKRFLGLILFFVPLCFGLFFLMSALNSNIVYFISPTELIEQNKINQRLRLGGLVKSNSISVTGKIIIFDVTDGNNSVSVKYEGLLPDLFKEDQGVIVEGKFDSNSFNADNLLAKHDENYIPREIKKSLKKQGLWKGENSD